MARIAGIDLPKNKRGVIGLTYIYGIGSSKAAEILDKSGISQDKKVSDWNDDELAAIRGYITENMKTEGELQKPAVTWAKRSGRLCFIGVLAVCIVNPLVNPGVFDRWFDFPLVMFVLLIPALCFAAFLFNDLLLKRLPKTNDRHCWLPFLLVVAIFILCFSALAFSFFPDVVPGQMTIWQAASAPESLTVILIGALVVVPVILAYTAFSYWVFRGKASSLNYH